MKLVTLLTLRDTAKLFANQRSSAFLLDSDWDRLINLAGTDLYDLQVQLRGHEPFEKVASLSTTTGSAIVALPADWYETLTIILSWGAQQLEEVDSLDHIGDQVAYRNWNSWAQWSPKAWRQRGNLIEFFPTPSAATTIELRYIPTYQDLVSDASTLDGSNGWDEMISALAAMKALTLQALPTAGVEKIYAGVRERVELLAEKRAAANGPSIRDVRYGYNGRGSWWRRRILPPPL